MRNKKGFTLIELLIVIAIIGLLATLAIVSLTSAQQKARDSKRLGDIRQLQNAVELYFSQHPDGYPTVDATAGDTDHDEWSDFADMIDDYITQVPAPPDPDSETYQYGFIGGTINLDDATGYVLQTVLEEDTNSALDQSIDGDVTVVGGIQTDDSATGVTVACTPATDPYEYCISN